MNVTWKKITGWASGLLVLGALLGAFISLTAAGPLQTDKEAQVWQKSHVLTEAEKFKADRVDRVERESVRIKYDLLDETLSIKKIDFMKRQLIENDTKIKCIRADTC